MKSTQPWNNKADATMLIQTYMLAELWFYGTMVEKSHKKSFWYPDSCLQACVTRVSPVRPPRFLSAELIVTPGPTSMPSHYHVGTHSTV